VTPVLASTIGQIFRPLYEALAWTLAFFYAIVPNYAIAIALLTLAVMIVTAPFTVKSTRSQIAMQRLAPELKKIQQKYKGDRVTLNEEMMKLYKEHNINPASGCVPLLLQLPVFIVLYGVIRGITNTVRRNGHIVAQPNYISHQTRLYRDLVAANGHMKAFGLDLANSIFSHHASWVGAIPYGGIIVVAIALQYLQMRQLNSRNPGLAQANPQMQMMQRYMPLVFAFIYLRISAGVNIYFVVSSMCRIGIQEAIFRSGVLDKAPAPRGGALPGSGAGARRKTLMERLADAQQRALEQQRARQEGRPPELEPPRPPARPSGAKPSGTGAKGPSGPKRPDTKPSGGTGKSGSSPPRRPSSSGGGDGTRTSPGPSANGGASSNGGPVAKPQPQGHSRSNKKRPRKAR
jgi:YidC/Oxa1 family membrane protein insertase